MNAFKEDAKRAERTLESAYLVDRLAYLALPRRNKDLWAQIPPYLWPNSPDFLPWLRARIELLAAELAVYEALRKRSADIVRRQKLRALKHSLVAAPYVERIADTVPDALPMSMPELLPHRFIAPPSTASGPAAQR